MTTYESDIKTISSSEEVVFGVLCDMNNLKTMQDQAPANNNIKDLQFDADSCSFTVEGFGKIGFRIIEREPFSTIKLESENTPFQVNVWVQLKSVEKNLTALKLTLKAEIPMMIKMMVDKKLKEGVNMIADLLVKAFNKLPNS